MRRTAQAFTRLELVAVLAALAFVAILALPLFAATRTDSERAACFNNLRQLGHATRVWGSDHNDLFPWLTPVNEGGTQPVPIGGKTAVAWTELITFTNELSTPRLLACPSDSATKIASHWGNTANGFANSGFRGNALSYFVSYHCQTDLPRSVISGDRDFRPSSFTRVACSRGPVNVFPVATAPPGVVAWTNDLHFGAGHLLFTDGSVDYVGSAKLQGALVGLGANDNNGSIHFINAR